MNKIFGAVMFAAISFGATGNGFADTNAKQHMPANAQHQNQVAQLQKQVDALTGEIGAIQIQSNTPSPNEHVIDNLATGG